MSLRYLVPMLVIVISNVVYHLCQKSIGSQVNFAASLTLTYLVALILSGGLFFFSVPARDSLAALQSVGWPSYLLALGVVGIEAGFLLAYRFGWPVSTAALYSTAALTVLLMPIGTVAFREPISWLNALGIALALAGIALMSVEPAR